jgi:hypothetical protein
MTDRETIQRTYIRVCGDSGFRMTAVEAAGFTSKLLDLGTPLMVWLALGLDTMEEIAVGRHPALLNPRYADEWTRTRAKTIQLGERA